MSEQTGEIPPQPTSKKETSNTVPIEITQDISIQLPDFPWMPTHAGIELRVVSKDAEPLSPTDSEELKVDELLKVGRNAVISADVAKAFSETTDPEKPNWYSVPWMNINFNADLGDEKFPHLTCQTYIRQRNLRQTRLKNQKTDQREPTDEWDNPYWTVPIPVDYPLNPSDRQPYDPETQAKIRDKVRKTFEKRNIEDELDGIQLFTEENGSNSLDNQFNFKINKGNYPVWQMGDYMLVIQDNPLVDREDGIHFVLIYRGEQEEPSKRYAFPWRDKRRMAEMNIISAAVAKIITTYGYGDSTDFDRSYIHLNANWSLGYASPQSVREKVKKETGSEDMYKGSMGGKITEDKEGKLTSDDSDTKWPGPETEQTMPGPNTHPHIQVLKKGHDLNIAPSGHTHGREIKARQTDEEVNQIKEVLNDKLTPLIRSLKGQTLGSQTT